MVKTKHSMISDDQCKMCGSLWFPRPCPVSSLCTLSLTTQTLSQPPTSKSELSIEVQVLQVPVFCFTMYLNICWLPKRVEVARNLSIFYSFKRYFQFNRKNYLSKFFIFNFFVSIYFMLTCKYLGSCWPSIVLLW